MPLHVRLVDLKTGRPVRKLELRAHDGPLLGPADTRVKPAPSATTRARRGPARAELPRDPLVCVPLSVAGAQASRYIRQRGSEENQMRFDLLAAARSVGRT